MRLGLVTPIVTRHPENDAAWTEDAGPSEIATIARAADRLGFAHLTCSEHVAVPAAAAPIRGTRYYDPLATFGFLAAQTTAIRFVTPVLVLGYHHPLAIAKRYGTLDRISGGRLVLGVGVGTLEDEFRLLGARFQGRGPIYEDALRALRAAFGRREPHYEGSHHRFADVVVDPCGLQTDVPIWLGGRTARSLRRVLVFGDGWNPFGLYRRSSSGLAPVSSARCAWSKLARRTNGAGRPPRRGGGAGFPRRRTLPRTTVQSSATDSLTPNGRAEFLASAGRYRRLGATCLNVRLRHRSLDHYLEQLAIVAAEVAPLLA